MRFAFIAAGLFLAGNAVYITLRLISSSSMLTLALLSPALLAALALGALLVVKNARPAKDEEDSEES